MTLNGCAALGGRDFNLKVAVSRKRCEIGPRLQLITNRKSYTGFNWHRKQWPWMILCTEIEVFYGFCICSQCAFIHSLLSRVPFALAGLSCISSYGTCASTLRQVVATKITHRQSRDLVFTRIMGLLFSAPGADHLIIHVLFSTDNLTSHAVWPKPEVACRLQCKMISAKTAQTRLLLQLIVYWVNLLMSVCFNKQHTRRRALWCELCTRLINVVCDFIITLIRPMIPSEASCPYIAYVNFSQRSAGLIYRFPSTIIYCDSPIFSPIFFTP